MTTEDRCPICNCPIGDTCIIKDGVAYCCEPCATGGICQCGCCTIAEPPREAEPKKGGHVDVPQ